MEKSTSLLKKKEDSKVKSYKKMYRNEKDKPLEVQMLTFIKLKPLGKIAHLDMHDPWNRLRGSTTIVVHTDKSLRERVLTRIRIRDFENLLKVFGRSCTKSRYAFEEFATTLRKFKENR